MANNQNSNTSNSSVFRGLHYNPGGSSSGTSSGLHFVNQLLHNHLQQQHSPSQNFSSNLGQAASSSSGVGNQIISTTPTAVSLPAPAPVPGKSSTSIKSEASKVSTSRGSSGGNPDQTQSLVAKLWFDHNLESSLSSLEKDEHDKRMKDLRKQLEYISDTNWKYSPIEKYIGQI